MSQLKKIINSKIIFGLLIIAFLDISSFISGYLIESRQEGLATLINLSGNQRMLSQRTALLLLELSHSRDNPLHFKSVEKELEKNLAKFKKAHVLLTKRVSARDNMTALKDLYFGTGHLDKQITVYLKRIKSVKEDLIQNKDAPELDNVIAFAKEDLLLGLDQAVTLFEALSEELSLLLNRIEKATVTLNLIGLFLIYILIFNPLKRFILVREEKLEKAQKIAKQESKFKTLFLANMSHELRTPLNGILGVADLLASTPLTKEQDEYVAIIDKSGTSLLSIINNILDLTRLELGNIELDKVIYNPTHIISGIKTSFQYAIESKGLEFEIEHEDLPELLIGDENRISQIIYNLVGNAVKFTHKGVIRISLRYINKQLVVDVEDSGIGITQNQQNIIFEPFRQAQDDITRDFGGAGLGLTISKQLVKKMDGSITIKSEPFKGSRFTVTIPQQLGDPEKYHKENARSLKEISSENPPLILIVDDNEINRNLLKKVVERLGGKSITASGSEKAMEAIQKYQFDLIFMDYHMPLKSGIEVTKEIKDFLGASSPPVIMITADISHQASEAMKTSLVDKVIPKPVKKDNIKRIFDEFIFKNRSEFNKRG